MIKTLANKYRGNCGSVQSIAGQPGSSTKQYNLKTGKNRLPDCDYLLHAGIASARRHRSKSV